MFLGWKNSSRFIQRASLHSLFSSHLVPLRSSFSAWFLAFNQISFFRSFPLLCLHQRVRISGNQRWRLRLWRWTENFKRGEVVSKNSATRFFTLKRIVSPHFHKFWNKRWKCFGHLATKCNFYFIQHLYIEKNSKKVTISNDKIDKMILSI